MHETAVGLQVEREVTAIRRIEQELGVTAPAQRECELLMRWQREMELVRSWQRQAELVRTWQRQAELMRTWERHAEFFDRLVNPLRNSAFFGSVLAPDLLSTFTERPVKAPPALPEPEPEPPRRKIGFHRDW